MTGYVLFMLIWVTTIINPQNINHNRHFNNAIGGGIATIWLVNTPRMVDYNINNIDTFKGLMTITCGYIAYWTIKDEIKTIKLNKQGLYPVAYRKRKIHIEYIFSDVDIVRNYYSLD